MSFADKFRVNVKDYPIFSQQVELSLLASNDDPVSWNIDRVASEYVTRTANIIAIIDGSAEVSQKEERKHIDHVIYLDKSARPVSWIVDAFWEDFSEKELPGKSFLSIDRLPWYRYAKVKLDAGGYMENQDGSHRRPTYKDFIENAGNIPEDYYARIRGLYIENGIEKEDAEAIMHTQTILDGKNILIVDEVSDTGVTLQMAEFLLRKSIPELGDIYRYAYWKPGSKVRSNGEHQMLSTPVWYHRTKDTGRGIGPIDTDFYDEQYRNNPSPQTLAQKYGSIVLGKIINLEEEPGQESLELMKEIQKLHEDYDSGKILLKAVDEWDDKRQDLSIEKQGLRLAPQTDTREDVYINVVKEIESRSTAEK